MTDRSPDLSTAGALAPYQAVLLVSFGGPERPEEVLPFLENVTRGRGIPRERLAEVGEHYLLFGGRSPINDQCRMLLAALRNELATRGLALPLFWGNRNSAPFLSDEVRAIEAAGLRRVLAVVTSAYPSYSSCRQYRENLYDAASGTAVQIDRIRHYANHPGFVAAAVDATIAALHRLGEAAAGARLVFVTHSIPVQMAVTAGPEPRTSAGAYVDWHAEVAAEVTRQVSAALGRDLDHDLVYCSRSGPAEPAVVGAGRQRSPAGAACNWAGRGRAGADRLRLRSHGGDLRPGYRGSRDRRRARVGLRAGRNGRRAPGIRGRTGRPDAGTGRRGAGGEPGPASSRIGTPRVVRVLARLLSQPARSRSSGADPDLRLDKENPPPFRGNFGHRTAL